MSLSASINQKLKNKAKEMGAMGFGDVDVNILRQQYYIERFLARIAVSEYRDNFIIKGGLLLSNIISSNVRFTRDIDGLVKNMDFDKNVLSIAINTICDIDLGDGIDFVLEKIERIRVIDYYGGYRFTLYDQAGKGKDKVPFELATGDIITPKEADYTYRTIFGETILIKAYTLETILAEKLQTILNHPSGPLNSRMKDLYDVYAIRKLKWNALDISLAKQAVQATFSRRKSALFLIQNNAISKFNDTEWWLNINNMYWPAYAKDNPFVKDIQLDELKKTLLDVITELFEDDENEC